MGVISQQITIFFMKPRLKPSSPNFSSGPTKKFPTWDISKYSYKYLGRSHRAPDIKPLIKNCIYRMKNILKLPEDYKLGVVPGSDTGAFEMAMWSVLGERGVDVLAWEAFGKEWVDDVKNQLPINDVRVLDCDWGDIPNLYDVDCDRDIIFTFNGTTSGVRVPDTNWISSNRNGLTIVDATSACFAMEIDWSKIDIATFSWQKSLGGEGGHGVIILSPRSIERLESYSPIWPIPKLFRLTRNGKLLSSIFEGNTINTPSMLCFNDLSNALDWVEKIGGIKSLIKKSQNNLEIVKKFVQNHNWIDFLCISELNISSTSICLKFTDQKIVSLAEEKQRQFSKEIVKLLFEENVAFDIESYRSAPPGLRIWGGPTVETNDIKILLDWIYWAYKTIEREQYA